MQTSKNTSGIKAVASAVATGLALLSSASAQPAFDPAFYADAWTDVCAAGKMQSPINIAGESSSMPSISMDMVTTMQFPVVKGAYVTNTGHSLKVEWDPATAFDMSDDSQFPIVAAGGDRIADALLGDATPEYRLKMIPIQMHLHTVSEHARDGMMAAAEAHIVTAVGPGEAPAEWGCDAVWEGGAAVLEKCIAVFGVMYKVNEFAESPAYMKDSLAVAPMLAGDKAKDDKLTLDLGMLVPEDKSYFTYVGSLTTPPCAEGLRWHVFNTMLEISMDTAIELEEFMCNTVNEDDERLLFRHNNRPLQPLYTRTVSYYDDMGVDGVYGDAAGAYGA